MAALWCSPTSSALVSDVKASTTGLFSWPDPVRACCSPALSGCRTGLQSALSIVPLKLPRALPSIPTEDALGDMDFKVAGDETGITAFQVGGQTAN